MKTKCKLLIALIPIWIAGWMLLFPNKAWHHESEPRDWIVVNPICRKQEVTKTEIKRLWKQNDLVDYAWQISSWNMDFILTVEGESEFKPDAVSPNWLEKWLCQRHKSRFNDVQTNPSFTDKFRQVERCWSDYQKRVAEDRITTMLYAYNIRHSKRNRFSIVKTVWFEKVCF